MDTSEWKHVFANIQRQGLLIDENVLTDNFQDVVNKAFDPDMGFGYISEHGYKPKARVILQGKNPFLDSHTGLLSSVMAGYLPYSQVYQVAQGGGNTLCILRHYLDIPGLSAEEMGNIGNVSIDMDTLIKKKSIENLWIKLENCKSGEVLISAKFASSPENVENEEDVSNQTIIMEKEVIIKEFEAQKEHTTSFDEPKQVLMEQSDLELKNPDGYGIQLVDPIYCDDEYVVVEKNNKNWFLVVSSLVDLPINVNLVPFKQTSDPNSAISIYPLPRGGFHNIKRVIHSGRGLKKCGYEKPCVLRAGDPYQVWSDAPINL